MTEQSTLTLDVRAGESVTIGDQRVRIELMQKSGQVARLKISAPRDEKIQRHGVSEDRAKPD